MSLPDEIAQTIDQTTESLEALPHILNHQYIWHEQHEHKLQEKQTDVIPALRSDTSGIAVTWRQARQFREDNEYSRPLLEQQRAEMQLLITDYNHLKNDFESEIANVHDSYKVEMAFYHQQFRDMMAEHNHLRNAYQELEDRYQQLFHDFQGSVEEETQKKIIEATQVVLQSPKHIPAPFQQLVRAIEQQCRQEEDKQLAEALYLKRECYRIRQQLEHERQQLKIEYQHMLVQQHNAQKQAELRQMALQARLQARWRMASVLTSLGVVASLVIFQFLFLSLLHVHLTHGISLSILLPIALCLVVALVLATPVGLLRYLSSTAPDKRKVK
jgi:hypothetical protein